MITLASDPAALIALGAPRVITSDQMLAEYTTKLLELDSIADPSPEQVETINLMSLLVQTYEREHYSMPRATPGEVLRFLMEQHGLKPVDLVAELGSEAEVSMVLAGDKPIAPDEAEDLAHRFNVVPSVFRTRERIPGK